MSMEPVNLQTGAATCEAFRAASATKACGAFRDMPHARTGETPCIQHRHFGAVIACVRCNVYACVKASGTPDATWWPPTRLVFFGPNRVRI